MKINAAISRGLAGLVMLGSTWGSLTTAGATTTSLTWLAPTGPVTGVVSITAKAIPPTGERFIQWCLRVDGAPETKNLAVSNPYTYSDLGGSSFYSNGCWQDGSTTVGISTGELNFDTGTWTDGLHRLQFILYTNTGRKIWSSVLRLRTSNPGPVVDVTAESSPVSNNAALDFHLAVPANSSATISSWCLRIDDSPPNPLELVHSTFQDGSIFSLYDISTEGPGCWKWTGGFVPMRYRQQSVIDTVFWRNGVHVVTVTATDDNGHTTSVRRALRFFNRAPEIIGIVPTYAGYFGTSAPPVTLHVTAVRGVEASVTFHRPGRPSLTLTTSFGASPDVAVTLEGLVPKSTYVIVVTVRSPNGVASRTIELRVP